MSSPAVAAARLEISTALEVAEPKIRGAEDMARSVVSSETAAIIQSDLGDFARRRHLCQAVVAAIDALFVDGYPDVSRRQLPPAAFDEVHENLTDLAAYVGQLEEQLPAAELSVEQGQIVVKPGVE